MKLTCHLSLAAISVAMIWGSPALAADNTIPLPAGTELHVRMTTTLSTKESEDGDPWTGRVIEPIFAQGREVVPAESSVEGHVTYVKPAGRATGKGEMRLVAETISTQEGTFVIVASLENAEGGNGVKMKGDEGTIQGPDKGEKGAAKEVGIGAAGGAAIGALAHGGTGALVGAGVGVMAAAIHSLAKKHKGVVLSPGTELTFILSRNSLAKQAPRPQPTTSSN
jgi:hypothetical protein